MKKYKVKMLKILASAERTAKINDEIIIDEAFAKQLLSDKACEVIEIIEPEEVEEEVEEVEEVEVEEVEEDKKGKKSKKSSKRR